MANIGDSYIISQLQITFITTESSLIVIYLCTFLPVFYYKKH